MKARLAAGRDFDARDIETAPKVAIVNETLARRYWPGTSAVGKRIRLGSDWVSIVGVVKDVKQREYVNAPEPELYFPFEQDAGYLRDPGAHRSMTPVVRLNADAASVVPRIQDLISSMDRNIAVSSILSMERVVSDVLWQQRALMSLLGGFSGLALILASLGIYGVMSYVIASRTQEIGIRMAMGASRAGVVAMVLKQSMAPVSIGIAVGIAGALFLTRLMKTLLYETQPNDPWIFAGVTLLLITVATAAAAGPARRAATVDPLVALRNE
jgi:predicted permease